MKRPKNKKQCAKQDHPLWNRIQLSPGSSPVSYHCDCGERWIVWDEYTPQGRRLVQNTHPEIEPITTQVGEFRL